MSDRSDVQAVGRINPTRRALDLRVDRCVHAHHLGASCSLCVEACPVGAVTLGATIVVDGDICTGCGLCAAACPCGAVESRSLTLTALCRRVEDSARRSKRIAFHCARYDVTENGGPEQPIRVPCLGRIDAAVLLTAAAAGVETICLYDGACAQCAQGRGFERTMAAVRQVNHLLAGFAPPSALRVQSRPSSAMTPSARPNPRAVSRRAFFSAFAARPAAAAAARVPSFAEEMMRRSSLRSASGAAADLPSKWRILSAALHAMPGDPGPSVPACGLWTDVVVGEGCNGCQMCAESCPTGALAVVEEEGLVGLSFTAARCARCALCVDACAARCLAMTPLSDLGRLIDGRAEILARHDRETVDFLTASMGDKLRKLFGTTVTY